MPIIFMRVAFCPRMERGPDSCPHHGERHGYDKERQPDRVPDPLQGDIVTMLAVGDHALCGVEGEGAVCCTETGAFTYRSAASVAQFG